MKQSHLRAVRTVREQIGFVYFLIALLCCTWSAGWAAVTVTPAANGMLICSNKAVSGPAPAFTNLGAIVITEGLNTDLNSGTDIIVLNAPPGWQFNTVLPALNYITGSNITGVTGSITASALTINIAASSTSGADQVTITGLQVQAISTASSPGNIYASSVSGVAGIATGSSGTNFCSLSLAAPVTPAISIAASPVGAICPGTPVTFTPAIANGGPFPSYQWYLNGVNVASGTSYNNSALVNANTISCRLTSSASCVTANPVFSNTVVMTVNAAPAPITVPLNTICPGVSTTLSDATASGVWSSTNPAVAAISAGGVVTGAVAGTTIISYTAGSCAATASIIVNNPPQAPVLTPSVTTICNGTSTAIMAVGTPAPSTILSQNFNAGIAPWTVDTVGSTGLLQGAEWKICGNGYVNEMGLYNAPDNSAFVMANADTSGSASYTSVKLISPTFSLAGYSGATLTFQQAYDPWPSGDLNVTLDISTNGGSSWAPLVDFIGQRIGSKTGFVAQSFSLNSYLGAPGVMIRFNYYCHWGYFWALDNILITGTPSVVVPSWSPTTYLFSDPGLSTPYMAGTPASTVYVYPTTVLSPSSVTYTALSSATTACSATSVATVNVNPSPGVTTGSTNICAGTTSALSNSAVGGTWVSSVPAVATIGSNSGIVQGIATGTTVVSYVLGSSCGVFTVVTVNIAPAPISGPNKVCLGSSISLSDASGGGTWTSSNTTVATIGTDGVVAGMGLGTTTITYSLGIGCTATSIITVNAIPVAITGPATVCTGLTTSLNNATPGGVWTSGNIAIATIGTGSGMVTGVAAGTANVTYTVTTSGCTASVMVTVNPLAPITGTPAVCAGLSTPLADAVAGGAWSSDNAIVATINPTSGLVNGVNAGTANITYALSTGCKAYSIITVNPLPADITGSFSICAGAETTLHDATTGGTWSSNNNTIASIGSTNGTANGNAAGIITITYTLPTGCIKTAAMTVNALPAVITGVAAVCSGLTIALNDATIGGVWTSSNTTIAAIGTNGIVTGGTAGTSVITYTLPSTCIATRVVTTEPLPANITGTFAICVGQNTMLGNTTASGTWGSSNTSIANIGPGGLMFGIGAGTATISYVLSTGCLATTLVTVNPLPSAIAGTASVCAGLTTALTSNPNGGTWSSSDMSVGTIGPTGIVSGLLAGTTTVIYTLPTSCAASRIVTVNPLPATINGPSSVCRGLSINLTDASGGGTWTSSNTGVASIVSGTGTVGGVAEGTATITYTLPTSCLTTTTITVNPLPANMTGATAICYGLNGTLNSTTSGGSWTSGNTPVATIGSSTGLMAGAGPGTAIITYTLPTSCITTALITVNPLPGNIFGASRVCAGSSANFTDGSPGGTWSSNNIDIATVGSLSGIVTGVAAGTANITYTLPTGCIATKLISVDPIPAAITGPLNICQGATSTLGNATAGGTWTSNTISVATIGSSTGLLTGMGGGVTLISYTIGFNCSVSALATVTASPAAITGSLSICEGGTSLLTDATAGGSWVSSTPAAAAIGTSGIVTAVVPGTTTITYTLPIGCFTTATLTVNPIPASISGSTNICMGSFITLSNSTPGGTWSSSNTSVANAGPATGVIIGYALGTTTITYTLSTGCIATAIVTVGAVPAIITGAAGVCVGATANYTNSAGGGIWASSNASVATIGSSSGTLNGIATGSATITYTLSSGCATTKNITVNSTPSSTTGAPAVCQGLSATLSNSTGSGTWTSSTPGVATIGPTTGLVNGIAPGTTSISYTLNTGCAAIYIMTVYALPTPITGSGNICAGTTTTLNTATAGGTWGSSNTSVAAVDVSGGVVSGVGIGTSAITYTLGIGCSVSKVVTVNPLPTAITGIADMCVGVGITLGNTSPGGTWSSGSTGVATISSSGGAVTAVAPGTAIITYTLGSGCTTTATVTVNTVAPITGNASICLGSISSFSHSSTGGAWSSSNTTVVGIGTSNGIAIGYALGTATISYRLPSGCIATVIATVSPLPAAISGNASVCPGFTISLTNASPGGSWSSSNTTFAAVGSGTGIVTGIAPGPVTIAYTLSSGCAVLKNITVSPVPSAITGNTSVCVGMTTSLSSGTPGGTWGSGNTAVATVGVTTGTVNGIVPGTAAITYTPSSGCIAILVVSVNGLPSTVGGVGVVCEGQSMPLTDATPGGTWSSNNTSIATVGLTTGVVTGVSAGSVTMSYTLGVGCWITANITVNTMPAPISGTGSICQSYTSVLAASPAGGVWSSGNMPVASVGAGGIVSGISAGTAAISYTLGGACSVSKIVTVSPAPSSISGTPVLCAGGTTTLSDPAAGGGTWSSNNASIAVIGSANGVINGVAAGSANITYTIGTGCATTTVVTVNPLPAAITGPAEICVSLYTLLSSTPGGTWAIDNSGIATIGLYTGLLTGVSVGTTNITYTLPTGCLTYRTVTVDPLPGAISGSTIFCQGSGASWSNTVPGGTWVSGNTSVATVGPATGYVSGINGGTTVISYVMGAGCAATAIVTVSPLPSAVGGVLHVCQGLTTLLSNTIAGGTWVSSNTLVATVGSGSGIVTGVMPGTAAITYTLPTGCSSFAVVTVDPLAANTGVANVCVGFTTALFNANSGGVWSSGNTSIAVVSAVTGVVTGVTAGTANITYQLGTGCRAITMVSVIPLSPVSGTPATCVGQTTTLSSAATGGTWSSDNITVATVGSNTGVVTGISAGTASVTYTFGTGCMVAAVVTVYPLAAITGAVSVCSGLTATLSDAVPGGTWASSDASIAGVGSISGIVTGGAAGTAIITYQLPTGCKAMAAVTVNPLAAITGTRVLCATATTTLNNIIAGGTWASGNTAIANVGTSSGIVTGISAGTAVITYTLGTGCASYAIVTVSPLPAAITGGSTACEGVSIPLSSTPGVTWSSSNTAAAAIDAATGLLVGNAAGTSIITATAATGCTTTITFTVYALPAAIIGAASICDGATTTLINTTAGGTWSSSNAPVAVIGSIDGVVSGMLAGTAAITYTLGTGCTAIAAVTVQPLPAGITGSAGICAGAAITLHCTTPGGTWTTDHPTVASIDPATGAVMGIAAGTTTIAYVLGTGCNATTVVTVYPLPAAMTGMGAVCAGAVTSFNDAIPGGTWASANTAIAAVDVASGIATGIGAGTTTISYILSTGCVATAGITVNPSPPAIGGIPYVCLGLVTTLSNAMPGGIWSSSAPATATINISGSVAGSAAGTATISYALPSGCLAKVVLTVNPLPPGITGIPVVCEGAATTLGNAAAGGTWSSGNSLVAMAGSATGAITGMATGVAPVTYTLPTGCIRMVFVTVNRTPATITGTARACAGATSILNSSSAGGSWSSSNTGVAVAGSSGVVTGIAEGTAIITYALSTGCAATIIFTVDPLPAVISGTGIVCAGSSASLLNATSGGLWLSGNTAVATVDITTGVYTGVTPGVAPITYSLPTGCIRTAFVVVNPLPATITGLGSACVGGTSVVANASSGGTWSSSNTAVATISATGMVSALSAGTSVVTYTLPSGCSNTIVFTVHPLPPAITGSAFACLGAMSSLSNAAIGGTWSSSSPAVATVGVTSGIITGISLGEATITYTLPTGCRTTTDIIVNPLPAPVSGIRHMCMGSFTSLTSTTLGGIWSSSNAAIGTVGAASGIVIGMGAGVTTIAYTLSTGCSATAAVTVDPLYAIDGSSRICAGSGVSMSNTAPGGTWSSSTPSVITISGTGVATGVASGVAIIYYALPTGCIASKVVTVDPLPMTYSVTGGGSYCSGGEGIHVGLSGSAAGFGYQLYNGTVLVAYLAGTGVPLDFGALTSPGIYTVLARDLASGCARNMAGSAAVIMVTMGPAAVSITTSTGSDTVCMGSAVLFTPSPYLGGSAPAYVWKVNGAAVGTSISYSYIPADGDVVSCMLTSNASCAVPNIATATRIMHVSPVVLPAVSVGVVPDINVCQYTPVTFIASPLNGGTYPRYSWVVNGVVTDTGVSYTYTPANGDLVHCVMTSNARCRVTDEMPGSDVLMTVAPYVVPDLYITASPGLDIAPGTTATFTATVSNGGVAPTFQWKVNSTAIAGATNAVFEHSGFADKDTVSCLVEGTGPCAGIDTARVVVSAEQTGIDDVAINGNDIRIFPDPNNGTFTIAGPWRSSSGSDLRIELTDMLGQIVYRGNTTIANGKIDTHITLNEALANGMYLLTLRSGTVIKIIHFVLKR